MIQTGDKAYIIANNNRIVEYKVIKIAGGFITLKEINGNGGIRPRASKVFSTYEDAQNQLTMNKFRY